MKSIVEEKLVSFKTLEQKVFRYVCELAQEITRILLENYDAELAEGRDKSQYRDKGKRMTTIKTVYGEVSYARRVYQTNLEDGRKACVYLLDEAMHMDKIGLLSTNLAEKIAMTVTESPYRVTAEIISETCGQSISHGGAWNLVQRLGERIREEEDHAVKQMEAGQAEGRESLPVLFEEMDGVWLSMQDKDHKKMKKQEIKRKLKEKEAQKAVTELFEAGKIDEMLEYIRIYGDSVESRDAADKRSGDAKKLYEYLSNNKAGLLPYQERGIKIPEAKPGIVYKDMGVQENQNCTAITLRMKHRRMRWSINGANNMAKALYRKENRELIDTIERYTDGLIFTMQMQEIVQTLSAAKAPKKEGKGNRDVDVITHHMPLLDAMRTASRKAFMSAFCS